MHEVYNAPHAPHPNTPTTPHPCAPCSTPGDFERNDEVYDAIDAASKEAQEAHAATG